MPRIPRGSTALPVRYVLLPAPMSLMQVEASRPPVVWQSLPSESFYQWLEDKKKLRQNIRVLDAEDMAQKIEAVGKHHWDEDEDEDEDDLEDTDTVTATPTNQATAAKTEPQPQPAAPTPTPVVAPVAPVPTPTVVPEVVVPPVIEEPKTKKRSPPTESETEPGADTSEPSDATSLPTIPKAKKHKKTHIRHRSSPPPAPPKPKDDRRDGSAAAPEISRDELLRQLDVLRLKFRGAQIPPDVESATDDRLYGIVTRNVQQLQRVRTMAMYKLFMVAGLLITEVLCSRFLRLEMSRFMKWHYANIPFHSGKQGSLGNVYREIFHFLFSFGVAFWVYHTFLFGFLDSVYICSHRPRIEFIFFIQNFQNE